MKNFWQFLLVCLFSSILAFSVIYPLKYRIHKAQFSGPNYLEEELRKSVPFSAESLSPNSFEIKFISSSSKRALAFYKEKLVLVEQGVKKNLEKGSNQQFFQEISTEGLYLTDEISASSSLSRAAFLASSKKPEGKVKVPKNLFFWEEGFGLEQPLPLDLFGDWRLQFSSFGRKLFLYPKSENSYLKYKSKKVEKSYAYQILLKGRGDSLQTTSRKEKNLLDAEFSLLSLAEKTEIKKNAPLKLSWQNSNNQKTKSLNFTPYDLDGNRISDLLLFGPGDKKPYWQGFSLSGVYGAAKKPAGELFLRATWRLGHNAGVPFTGDFDGDGLLDIGTYLPQQWVLRQGDKHNLEIYLSSGRPLMNQEGVLRNVKKFFYKGGDFLILPGDYNGDGITDIGFFQKSTGAWNILFTKEDISLVKGDMLYPGHGFQVQFGQAGLPLQGDYNGDGISDLAVYVESEGKSFFQIAFLGKDEKGHVKIERTRTINFAEPGDLPISADFNCNGKTDLAVYRPKDKTWWLRLGQDNIQKVSWRPEHPGEAIPIAADFDGDSCADFGFFYKRPNSPGVWMILPSKFKPEATELIYPPGHNMLVSQSFGRKDDLPAQVLLRQHHGFAFLNDN